MVTFKDTSFTIEVHTGVNPIEEWLETHDQLIDLLQCIDPDTPLDNPYYRVLELLRQMMPDYKTAKKMTE